MTKCSGCGTNILDSEKDLCERCFRIRNYNEYKIVNHDNIHYENILDNIKKTNDLVVLVVDIFGIDNIKYYKDFKNLIIVITKKDILPKKVSDEKILNYIDIPCIDKIVISSNKNYNFDDLYEMILKYKMSNNVYVVGNTNMGKSTMINKIIKNYSNNDSFITTSMLPSTTLNTIEIKINDELTIIDTPGIVDFSDICNYVSSDTLKKIMVKKEIKPVTYQIKSMQTIIIEDILKIVSDNANITLYMSNELKKERVYKKEGNSFKEFDVCEKSDIVIKGLGFITVHSKSKIMIDVIGDTEVYLRKSLL